MTQIKTTSPLQAKIDMLEVQRTQTLTGIKQQLKATGQSLKPRNMLRDAAKDIIESTDLKKLALKAGGAVAVAFILKQVLQKSEKHVQEAQQDLNNKETFWDRTLEAVMKYAGVFLAGQVNSFVQRQRAAHDGAMDRVSDPDSTYN